MPGGARRKTLRLDPFPFRLKIEVGARLEPHYEGLTTSFPGGALVQVARGMQYARALPAAVHEIQHAVCALERWIDGKLDEETRAYLSQKIFSEILKLYRKPRGCLVNNYVKRKDAGHEQHD